MKFIKILSVFLIFLQALSCARIGAPSGGEKDVKPPVILKISPPNYSTNFHSKEIKIYFDEYIVLKDLQKNLMISPPFASFPEISPTGLASKEIIIKFKNNLKPNTTYSFNFGKSIQDNNEGNVLYNFVYVFSTGDKIDSLSIKGKVIPVHFNKNPENIVVGLYPFSTYSDSIVYRQVPDYITYADSNGNFELKHLKSGKYKILAFSDENQNFVYNPGKEAIAFLNRPIQIPEDSMVTLNLFKEKKQTKIEDIKQKNKNLIEIKFKGNPDSIQIVPQIKIDTALIVQKGNVMQYWYKSTNDSIALDISAGKRKRKFKRKRKENPDSLTIKFSNKAILSPLDTLKISANIPLIKIDTTRIIVKKDSVYSQFSLTKTKDFQYQIFVSPEENKKYEITLLPDVVKDFFGRTNKDTLFTKIKFNKKSEFGKLIVEIPHITQPYFIEILDDKNQIILRTQTQTQPITEINYLFPKKYHLRIILDKNLNNQWDPGNFLLHKQPEKVIEIKKPIEIRANWDIKQIIKL